MERMIKFLKDAGFYCLAAINGAQPGVRPFAAAHIFEAAYI